VPEGLTNSLMRIQGDYGLPTFVTENGGLYADGPGSDGVVRDDRRVELIRGHLQALLDALSAGADVRGYCHWSLLDNFEWALGYDRRFGLVYVDYGTQRRTPKASARYYSASITARRPM
jgi:beta-glucosidase